MQSQAGAGKKYRADLQSLTQPLAFDPQTGEKTVVLGALIAESRKPKAELGDFRLSWVGAMYGEAGRQRALITDS
jgi:hypothetical protein